MFFFHPFGNVPISVRAKGAGGAAAPPEKIFSGKTAQIYVIKKRISGQMFGQTGFHPPQVGKIFWAKRKIFRANRCRPPKFGGARTPMNVP